LVALAGCIDHRALILVSSLQQSSLLSLISIHA
jgi:hypothetical protein